MLHCAELCEFFKNNKLDAEHSSEAVTVDLGNGYAHRYGTIDCDIGGKKQKWWYVVFTNVFISTS